MMMNPPKPAKQDDFVRITLRLPPHLHETLVKSAGASSLNAEIVSRLEKSESQDKIDQYIERLLKNEKRLMSTVIDLKNSHRTLEKQAAQLAELANKYAAERDQESRKREATEQRIIDLIDLMVTNMRPGTSDT